MNRWTKLSIDYANQQNYLDNLFTVYPTIPDDIRDIDGVSWKKIEVAFEKKDYYQLIRHLLSLDLFPIKDSYVAYLKRDASAIDRNPATIERLCGRLFEMGLDKIYERCSEPKETNRQIGPMFRSWVQKGILGAKLYSIRDFWESRGNAILNEPDSILLQFAQAHFDYQPIRDKGLDFVARFNDKYILGEAKFITDFGGHQNAQFEDGLSALRTPVTNAKVIGIFDGVLYIPNKGKLYKTLEQNPNFEIMSALVLREYLYQI